MSVWQRFRWSVGLVFGLSFAGAFVAHESLAPAPAFAAEGSIQELVESLGSEDSSERNRAYIELRNQKSTKALPLLVARLPEFALDGQYYGVFVLDAYPPEVVASSLRKLLKCDAPYLRVSAAQMLFAQGEKGMTTVIARELFREGLDRALWRKMMVRLRFGRIPKDEKLHAALVAPLVVGCDAELVLETAYVLKDLGCDVTLAPFEALLADERAEVRVVAAAYLCAQRRNQSQALAAALRTGKADTGTLYFVRDVFSGLSGVVAEPIVVDALVDSTRVEQPPFALRVVIQILEKLGAESALPRLRELVKHESSLVAKAAAQAVGKLSGTAPAIGGSAPDTDAADTIALTNLIKKHDAEAIAVWLEDEKATRRLAAADALRRMDDQRGLQVVLVEMTCKDAEHRRDATRILGNFRVDAAVEPLIAATLDEDVSVRSYSWSALTETLRALFPQRRFSSIGRGGEADTLAWRQSQAEQLRVWWAREQTAPW